MTNDYDSDCCINGHVEWCDALEPAWDIQDLVLSSGCQGCCPRGHKPEGFQAMQDQAAQKAKKFRERINSG